MKEHTESCKETAGAFVPVVNLSKCTGAGDCISVCPYDVFDMREISASEFKKLTWVGMLKTLIRGDQKAFTANPDACHACGLCVNACPEKAIKLIKAETNQPIY